MTSILVLLERALNVFLVFSWKCGVLNTIFKHINTPLIRKYAIKLIHAPILSFYSKFNWSDTTQGYRGYNNIIFKDKRISIFRNIFKKYELLAYLNYILPLKGYSCIEIPTFRKYNKFNKLKYMNK